MKNAKIFTLLCVLGSAICYFVAPYLQYPNLSGSLFSSKITYQTISCVDIFYNGDKFGVNGKMTNLLLGLIAISVILAICLVASKKNSKIFFALMAISQIISGALNGYLFYSFDNMKGKYAGVIGLLMDAVNIKFVYGIYLNIGLIALAIILSVAGLSLNSMWRAKTATL